jgi:hypothetical protein
VAKSVYSLRHARPVRPLMSAQLHARRISVIFGIRNIHINRARNSEVAKCRTGISGALHDHLSKFSALDINPA